MTVDTIRAIHSSTDLARAHSLVTRLIENDYDDRTSRVLRAALITDYARPFTKRVDESPALQLDDLVDAPLSADVEIHRLLIDSAQMLSRAVSESASMPWEERIELLEDLDLSAVRDLIVKLRTSLTVKLYPDAGDDPRLLEQLIGPAGSTSS